MQFEGFTDETIYPVEMSAKGSNAYHHGCDVTGHRAGYCVCVNKLLAYEAGRRDFLEECVRGIQYGTCPAKIMRKREVEAGMAIYYVDRAKLSAARDAVWDARAADRAKRQDVARYQPHTSTSGKKAVGSVATTPIAAPAPKKPQETLAGVAIDKTGFAEVLTAAAMSGELLGVPTPTPTPTPVPSVPKQTVNQPPKMQAQAGETPLQMARRLMQQQQGANQ